MRTNASKSRLLATVALFAGLALAGCQTTAGTTGSVASAQMPSTEMEWRRQVEVWGERYRKDQKDAEAAVRYAQALRAIGQRMQAVAVLEQATINNPQNAA